MPKWMPKWMPKYMPKCRRLIAAGILVLALLHGGPAGAQTPSPDAMAAARELVTAMRATEQFKTILPLIMQQLKPAIVQGRPEVERDYDAIVPVMLELMNARASAMVDAIVAIYARALTVDEMRQVTGFYRSPVGQKLLDKQPGIMRETMAVGQEFGRAVAVELQAKMVEELRKRGHKI